MTNGKVGRHASPPSQYPATTPRTYTLATYPPNNTRCPPPCWCPRAADALPPPPQQQPVCQSHTRPASLRPASPIAPLTNTHRCPAAHTTPPPSPTDQPRTQRAAARTSRQGASQPIPPPPQSSLPPSTRTLSTLSRANPDPTRWPKRAARSYLRCMPWAGPDPITRCFSALFCPAHPLSLAANNALPYHNRTALCLSSPILAYVPSLVALLQLPFSYHL